MFILELFIFISVCHWIENYPSTRFDNNSAVLFSVLISAIDSGIQRALNSFAEGTRLSGD